MALLGFTLPPDSGEKLTLGNDIHAVTHAKTLAVYNLLFFFSFLSNSKDNMRIFFMKNHCTYTG